MAIQAALTGHLVLSTLHTNDAPAGVSRLLDMGLEPYLLSSTLLGIAAQRLVRTPCRHCAAEALIEPREADALGLPADTLVTSGSGCPKCRQTGYRGRVGLYEILRLTPELAEAVHQARPTAHLRALARRAGMRSLRQAGAARVLEGLTTPREVLAVTPPDEEEAKLGLLGGNASCKTA
jgi:general secretion pathway protein E